LSSLSAQHRRLSAVAVGAAVVALGATAGVVSRRRAPGSPPPGELLRARGEEVHALYSRGSGSGPTVLFESAMCCPATSWSWVIEGLGADCSYLAYDRPGNGWTPLRRGGGEPAEAVVERQRGLLDALALPGPYVLVGHSVGGLLIRSFARRYPELVAGLVFVDSSHPDQLARSGAQRAGTPWLHQRLLATHLRARLGLLGDSMSASDVTSLPEAVAHATQQQLLVPDFWKAARGEFQAWQRSWSPDAAQLTAFSPKPVAVVTAAEAAEKDPVHGVLQTELATLSGVSRHDVVPDAGHEALVMRREHADAVVQNIEWVIGQAGGGTPRRRRRKGSRPEAKVSGANGSGPVGS